jgi:glucose-1-phosphatase
MIHAIVFDIGGVLICTEDHASREQLEKMYGLQPGEVEQMVFNSKAAQASTIGLMSEEAVWQNVANKLNLSPCERKEFQSAFWAGDKLDQDLINFLKDCQNKYTTALLSNAWEGARTQLAEKYGIKEGKTVDQILFSSELGVAKPDPKIYQILVERMNCNFNELLFVDDFIENIIAAKKLGIIAIHYQPGMDLILKIRNMLNLN